MRTAGDEEPILRRVRGQYLRWRRDQATTADFVEAVKKEPKYESDILYRGVITLGSDQYGFALDSSDIIKNGFHKFYFDRNQNGDLTDDAVIEAMPLPKGVNFGPGFMQREFPRQDMTVNTDGKKYDYSFFLLVYSDTQGQSDGSLRYASAQLSTGVYRKRGSGTRRPTTYHSLARFQLQRPFR